MYVCLKGIGDKFTALRLAADTFCCLENGKEQDKEAIVKPFYIRHRTDYK